MLACDDCDDDDHCDDDDDDDDDDMMIIMMMMMFIFMNNCDVSHYSLFNQNQARKGETQLLHNVIM